MNKLKELIREEIRAVARRQERKAQSFDKLEKIIKSSNLKSIDQLMNLMQTKYPGTFYELGPENIRQFVKNNYYY